jgi:hypothetical protein
MAMRKSTQRGIEFPNTDMRTGKVNEKLRGLTCAKTFRTDDRYEVYSLESRESEIVAVDLSFKETCRVLRGLERVYLDKTIRENTSHAFVENYHSLHYKHWMGSATVADASAAIFLLN